jgi:hypothetical protein
MGSQLDPLPLSRVGSQEHLPSPNFPQLHFGEHSSGFTPGLGSASICRNPTLAKCEDETHTLKVGDLESSGTPENSELDCRGQNTLHLSVIDIIEKVLKCRCPKWPRMNHLDICSPSYGQKKGRESNWQFDSRPLKVGNRPDPNVHWRSATWRWKALKETYQIGLDLVPIEGWGEKL